MQADPPRSQLAPAQSGRYRPATSTNRDIRQETWLRAAPVSVSRARAIVTEAAVGAGLSAEGTHDLILATSEAVANAVQHGEAWPNDCILLVTERSASGLRVEVADCGQFDSALEPAPLEATGGRGIAIIAAVVDRLEVRNGDGQTVICFERHGSDARGHVAA
jgi:anti-sigma regulatory factor (Ser/Thr protein kinase)